MKWSMEAAGRDKLELSDRNDTKFLVSNSRKENWACGLKLEKPSDSSEHERNRDALRRNYRGENLFMLVNLLATALLRTREERAPTGSHVEGGLLASRGPLSIKRADPNTLKDKNYAVGPMDSGISVSLDIGTQNCQRHVLRTMSYEQKHLNKKARLRKRKVDVPKAKVHAKTTLAKAKAAKEKVRLPCFVKLSRLESEKANRNTKRRSARRRRAKDVARNAARLKEQKYASISRNESQRCKKEKNPLTREVFLNAIRNNVLRNESRAPELFEAGYPVRLVNALKIPARTIHACPVWVGDGIPEGFATLKGAWHLREMGLQGPNGFIGPNEAFFFYHIMNITVHIVILCEDSIIAFAISHIEESDEKVVSDFQPPDDGSKKIRGSECSERKELSPKGEVVASLEWMKAFLDIAPDQIATLEERIQGRRLSSSVQDEAELIETVENQALFLPEVERKKVEERFEKCACTSRRETWEGSNEDKQCKEQLLLKKPLVDVLKVKGHN